MSIFFLFALYKPTTFYVLFTCFKTVNLNTYNKQIFIVFLIIERLIFFQSFMAYLWAAERVKNIKTLMQSEQIIFRNILKYETDRLKTKSTNSFAKSTCRHQWETNDHRCKTIKNSCNLLDSISSWVSM